MIIGFKRAFLPPDADAAEAAIGVTSLYDCYCFLLEVISTGMYFFFFVILFKSADVFTSAGGGVRDKGNYFYGYFAT